MQIIATSVEFTPNHVLVRESSRPKHSGNSGLGIVVICPDLSLSAPVKNLKMWMIRVVVTFAEVGKRLSKLLRYRACCWILYQGFVVLHRGEYIKKSWEGSAQKNMLTILSDFTNVTIYSAMLWLRFGRRGFGWMAAGSPRCVLSWNVSVLQVLQIFFKVECGKHVFPSLIIWNVKAISKKHLYILHIIY